MEPNDREAAKDGGKHDCNQIKGVTSCHYGYGLGHVTDPD
jgi:hypothetical protein